MNVFIALSLCVLLAGAVMIYEFYEHLEEHLEATLATEAGEIIGQIDTNALDLGLDADGLRFRGAGGLYRYTVFDEAGKAVVGGETAKDIPAQLMSLELGQHRPVQLPGDRIGVAMRARIDGQDFFVLASTFPAANDTTQIETLLHELEEQIIWVAMGVMMVIAAAVLATHRGLAPLGILARQAERITAKDSANRLRSKMVPAEVAPLIKSVNGALDRLDEGYRAQRDFSSNVAHEIRTPLAVLRSSVERIDDPGIRKNLLQDVVDLEQILVQLIDLSRAEAVQEAGFAPVDLRSLATDLAGEMALAALYDGHKLAVTGAHNVTVQGHRGLLEIALRNLVQNALKYTPPGSDVEIELTDDPKGWRVLDRGPGIPDASKATLFERFNRGQQTNSQTTGAGLGLSIVNAVAKSHDATVRLEDRNNGGAVFSLEFDG